jgi:O-antigen/teichoic acid export membrane protein
MTKTEGRLSIALLISVSACRLLCGLAVIKALSMMLGPAQFGTLSQIIGVATVFYSFAGGGVTNGLILFAGSEQDDVRQRRWLAAALTFASVASILLAGVALLLFAFGANAILGNEKLANVFLGIGVVQAVIGLGNVMLAYSSCMGDVRSFAIANIVGTLVWAFLTVVATVLFGYSGATWAVIVTPISSAVMILWLWQRPLQLVLPLMLLTDRTQIMKLMQASGLMALAICALPTAHTIIRADLALRDSWSTVGLWQSMARLSDAYMQVFGVIAVNFLLPRLLQCKERRSQNLELLKTGGAMLALYLLGALSLYALREPVIGLAYSTEFLPAAVYLLPQLFADFGKVGAWILVYRFIAMDQLWVQPAAEMFQAFCMVVFYFILWPTLGNLAPVTGHLLSCSALIVALGLATWLTRDR